MLQSQANWKFTYSDSDNDIGLREEFSLAPVTERLLFQRGIVSKEQAEKFLHPSLEDLHDPVLMNDIGKAAERVHQAIAEGEKILVFGDYDADGVSSTAVMLEALRELGADCTFYIPNRFTEGYGPNEQAFRKAKTEGVDLIITVDTGIAAVEEAEIAREIGVDLIITDHHEVQEQLPAALAIVHPKCSTDYPFQELAGVGVAFKFAQHLLGYFPKHLLDLTVIGTIADLVPLVNENRVLAKFGLKAISQSNRPGIKALKKVCKIEGDITEEHIGFFIGPRINAVGRLQDADMAVDLLLTQDASEAEELAGFIQELNLERQKIVADIAKEAEALVEAGDTGEHVIVAAQEGWNEGVLGIVASKLVRKYDRPAIVLSINADKKQAKGSARSIDAFDLFKNCMEIRETFTHFGGHAQAAGMTLPVENLPILRNLLNDAAASKLTEEDYKQSLTIDSTVNIEELDVSIIKEINKLAPFGMSNPKPLFHVQAKPKEIRQIGSQQNHLKFSFQGEQKIVDGVAFGMGDLYHKISPRSTLDVIGELEINEWNGKQKVQLMVKDLAVNVWQLFDYRGSRHLSKQIPLELFQESLAVCFHEESMEQRVPAEVKVSLYSEDKLSYWERVNIDSLILLDLPERLDDLEHLLSRLKPDKIFACFYEKDGHFLEVLPSREDFKWFYAMMLQRKQFDMKKELDLLAKHKGWKQEKIKFISEVFFELEFVKIEDGLLKTNPHPAKKDLTEAPAYQKMQNRLEIEKTLYYSSYDELRAWFDPFMEKSGSPKEEVSHGL
ncbi:single-stranded-DNA-specific exonuclease RecJ [Sediminibacillus dalangtanensis]|uniref:Single-stranded-DNA-specific exonuclease RecJ n=1 Tax=Sediminibacillus dalangtanensis TaxID=2729421 RepID=A0ABX7VWQ4_9BACI|nr:single-stranded-DNA-specific exonuclease RecJ [Sediminibacillus dalangtanensis]QTM99928.1 single-stranded-DNA-specific exonuclease RecJ [Sediminibacillus dalangtanensis]